LLRNHILRQHEFLLSHNHYKIKKTVPQTDSLTLAIIYKTKKRV
jgi:hypothetical protein